MCDACDLLGVSICRDFGRAKLASLSQTPPTRHQGGRDWLQHAWERIWATAFVRLSHTRLFPLTLVAQVWSFRLKLEYSSIGFVPGWLLNDRYIDGPTFILLIDRNFVDYVQERNLKAPRALIQGYHVDAGRRHLSYGQKRGHLRDDAVATTIIVLIGVEWGPRFGFRFREVGGDVGGVHAMSEGDRISRHWLKALSYMQVSKLKKYCYDCYFNNSKINKHYCNKFQTLSGRTNKPFGNSPPRKNPQSMKTHLKHKSRQNNIQERWKERTKAKISIIFS